MSDAISLIYNGFQFSERSKMTVSERMQYDSADRTVKYNVLMLRVETIVAFTTSGGSQGSLANQMTALRAKLSKAGEFLRFEHPGFGNPIIINGGSDRNDVAFGPKPRLIEWNPIGNEWAAEVVWEVEFSLPACPNGRHSDLASLNYTVDYTIDNEGFTTRTTSGTMEIAMTRRDRSIPDTADYYREILSIYKPTNFERTHNFSLSEDKRTLSFSIVDNEIKSGNPYPPGITFIDATHDVDWNYRQRGKLSNTINATIVVARDKPALYAWEIFRLIVMKRQEFAYLNGDTMFIESLRVVESLFSHRHTFALSYRINATLPKFFTSTGVFQGVPVEWNWDSWSESVKEIQHPRSIARLKHEPSDDVIIDLCGPSNIPNGRPNYPGYQNPVAYAMVFQNRKPPPDKSWLTFNASLTYYEDTPNALQIKMGPSDLQYQEFDPASPAGETINSDGSIDRFVETSAPGMTYVWAGQAERVGYEIKCPNLINIGGVFLRRSGRGVFQQKYVGDFFGQPKYIAAWSFPFKVVRIPIVRKDDIDPVTE